MAHFDYIKPGGTWSLFSLLSSSIMQLIDRTLYKCINGDDGGTWAPTSPIIIGGEGEQVFGHFVATDADITIELNRTLTIVGSLLSLQGSTSTFNGDLIANRFRGTIPSGFTLNVANGGTISFSGPTAMLQLLNDATARFEGAVYFRSTVTWQTGYSASALFEAGTSLTINPNASIELSGTSGNLAHLNVNAYGVVDVKATGQLVTRSGSQVTIASGTVVSASVGASSSWIWANTSTVTYALGSTLVHQNLSEETYQTGAVIDVYTNDFQIRGGGRLYVQGTSGNEAQIQIGSYGQINGDVNSNITTAGAVNLNGVTVIGSTGTLLIGSNANLQQTGSRTKNSASGYDILRPRHLADPSGETIDISAYDLVEIPVTISGAVTYQLTAPPGVRCQCQIYITSATLLNPDDVAVLKQGATPVATLSYNGTYAFGSVIITYDGTTMIPHVGKGAADGS